MHIVGAGRCPARKDVGRRGRPDITTYSYDAAGMRALKKGRYGTVQYVSDNYTVRNKDLISKHVFAGNTRLVSKTVMREEKSGKMTATEQGAYYYHPDHLGSSNVVTDKDGRFYEQIEYFPYGETWINNKATAEQTSSPYKFTAKEYDPETGWYYYGARYYDAKLSRWCSADPPLARGDYLPIPPISDEAKEQNSKLPGMGGVFNTINLDAYHYAGQNPVKLVDPDGNVTWGDVKSFFIGAGKMAAYTISVASLGHVPEERLDEIVPKPEFENQAEKNGAVTYWLIGEPAVAYLSLKALGPKSERSIRSWYNKTTSSEKIMKLNAKWIKQGVSIKDRAYKAWSIRHDARVKARGMMKNKEAVKELELRDLMEYGSKDGPTFEYLVEKYQQLGLKGDDVYQAIIESSSRTNKTYNDKYNIGQ